MKALLIDPVAKTVTEVDYKKGLKSLYKLLECEMVEAPVYFDNGDVLYCDEEAWLKVGDEPINGFILPGWHSPIIGRGLVVGTDHSTGDDMPCMSSIEDVNRTSWCDPIHLRAWGEQIGLI